MNLKCIAEHTVDLDLITRESKVLDLGCGRTLNWSKAMLEYVDGVIAVDADEQIEEPEDERINFIEGLVLANGSERKFIQFVVYGNGTGNYVEDGRSMPEDGRITEVLSITLNEIISAGCKPDLIKFDIEGSEIPVLLSLSEPPAKQLSIEFHIHTGTSKEMVHKVFDHLESLGYERVFTDYSRKHGLCENYWDVLFIDRVADKVRNMKRRVGNYE